ncbi:aromatic motif membrane protein [Mycoplasmopsis verecunda]|uniref:Aromatic cluster surface protein n=1 Tax=Mycoplasmopsis verecunda TaxID=171291 RepID=A0A1T4KFA7_9BACT|nr:aromatic motif membrane protein [Mycoplasmopsis verecunda]WPB54884.1 hypothetical protein SAM46_01870 [Mycoplasmopsis verecunda]SJZ41109.1 aromatic cluster surface protein [Mycoplasmopsis verecunda]
MKKWLINKILLLSTISLPILAVSSCYQKADEEIKLKPKKQVTNNEMKINQIASKLITNNQERDLYISQQKNIPDDIITELKASMIYANISNVKVLEKSSSVLNNQVKNAIIAITNTLTKDWYWYLNNLNKNKYVLNPFNENYSDITNLEETKNNPKNTKSIFQYVLNKNKTYAIDMKNANIQDIISYEIPNEKFDIYQNKKINFILFDNNTFILYFTYSKDNKNNILIIPDVFLIINNQEAKEITSKFKDSFITALNQRIQNKTNYDILTGSNQQEALDNAYKAFSDKKLFTMYEPNNYSGIFYDATMLLNNNEMQLLRYTWGEINED